MAEGSPKMAKNGHFEILKLNNFSNTAQIIMKLHGQVHNTDIFHLKQIKANLVENLGF